MARPRLIILIRHAQSEGNKNREIHQTIPDHRVKLTQDGWEQAYEAGRKLRALLRPEDTLHFFTSPYRRTRETTEGILATLTSDEAEPSPFKRNSIKVYEEPRLREQDFGNFQPCSAEMERMWQERADYGHFFYRIPNGESAADAYDRISGFNESLWRQFGEDDFSSVCVLVTHGLMSRVFLMKWYHFSVEYFEDLRNINHCEFLIMQRQESGKYLLENKLRTWSALRRERAAQAAKEKEKEKGVLKDGPKLDKATPFSPVVSSPIETHRRWGGCPDGCNHDQTFKIRPGLADLVQIDHKAATPAGNGIHIHTHTHNDAANGSDPPVKQNPSFNGNGMATSRRPGSKRFQALNTDAEAPEEAGPQIDISIAHDEVVSSPDGTPSFTLVEDRLRGHLKSPGDQNHSHNYNHAHAHIHYPDRLLHVGRDGGGTYSGHNSVAASDADSSEDEQDRRRRMAAATRPKITTSNGTTKFISIKETNHDCDDADDEKHDHSHDHDHDDDDHDHDHGRMGRGMRANRLGDAPHSSDGEHEADAEPEPDEEVLLEEVHEKSVQESVF